MMGSFKANIAAPLIAATALAAAAPALAGTVEAFTVVSGLPGSHPAVGIFREHFRAAVARQLAAADAAVSVEWRPAYDGTIASQDDVLEAIADGVGDIGIIAVDAETRQLPLQDISFHLPFTNAQCTVAAGAYHALHKQYPAMNEPWRRNGQIYLANITTDGYGLFTGAKIQSIEDLRGLTVALTVRIEGWLGGVAARPLRLPSGQLAGMLEAGSVGGAIMALTDLAELKLERKLPNYLLTEFGPQTAYAITINERRFAALAPPLRDALLAAADQFVPAGAQAYCDAGADLLVKLEGRSMRTQKFYHSRRAQWVNALPPLGRMWAAARNAEGRPGTEILSAYMDHVRAAGGQPKRHWDRDPAPSN